MALRPLLFALAWASPPPVAPAGDAAPPAVEDSGAVPLEEPRAPARERRFLVGLEGVGTQVPVPRSPLFTLDPRYVGDSGTLIGLGVVGRFRPVELVALEATVRSGSIRYRREDGDTLFQDLIVADVGAILWLARGRVGHFGIDAGWGGAFNQVRYTIREDSSVQRYGSAVFRAGADVELRGRRVAFIMALRGYGVVTDPRRSLATGPLFDGVGEHGRRAPAPVWSAYVAGSIGLAYRF